MRTTKAKFPSVGKVPGGAFTGWNGYVEGDYTFPFGDPKNSYVNRLGTNPSVILRGSRIIPISDLSAGDVIRFAWRGAKGQISTVNDLSVMFYLQAAVYLSTLSPQMPVSAANCDIEFDAEIAVVAKDTNNVTVNAFQSIRLWNSTTHELISEMHEPWYSQYFGVGESMEIGFGVSYDDPGFDKPRQASCRIYRESTP